MKMKLMLLSLAIAALASTQVFAGLGRAASGLANATSTANQAAQSALTNAAKDAAAKDAAAKAAAGNTSTQSSGTGTESFNPFGGKLG